MGRLQQTAQGLLSFLQLKDLGRNPADLADVLAPTVELRDWLMLNQWVTVRGVIADIGAGVGFQTLANNSLVVPQSECWWVQGLCGEILSAAGNTEKWTVARLIGGTASIVPYAQAISTAPADYGLQSSNFVSRDPFLIGPGDSLGVYVILNTHALAQSCTLSAQILRMKV